jgi:hypothetical protein
LLGDGDGLILDRMNAVRQIDAFRILSEVESKKGKYGFIIYV